MQDFLVRQIVPGLVWQDERGLFQPMVCGWAFGPAVSTVELATAIAEAETEERLTAMCRSDRNTEGRIP